MVQIFERPIVCPVVVGRERQLEALAELTTRLSQGVGGVALISGEAGMGKTRLVTEARRHAATEGMSVYAGNCFEPDRALPYAPVLDLIRRTVAASSPHEIIEKIGPSAAEVVQLLPELAPRFQDIAPVSRLEPEQEKRRLFEALTNMLLRFAERDPALIVVEDIHWCDDIGLEFLLHLARRVHERPLLLLATYRSDETQPGLRHLLAGLDRERLATEIRLESLGQEHVAAMFEAIFALGRPIRPEFLTALYDLTEGNPFFIEETLKALVVSGDIFYRDGSWNRKAMEDLHIPRSVQDAVRRRTQELSSQARQVLAVAAVAGQRFDFTLVCEITRLTEAELLTALKELIAAQLIVELSADQFSFRHALTRQAIYTELLARERKTLHQTLAEAIERLFVSEREGRLAELAYHYYEAGAWEQALETARLVGERSLALYAPHAAVEQFTHALEASRRLTLQPAPSLHRGRGQAYETLGNFELALADYEAALQGARLAHDGLEEWRATLALGALWAGRDYARTGEYYHKGFELARGLNDPAALARSLNRLGNWYLNVDQPQEALARHREALAMFEEQGDPRAIAETLDLLGMAHWLGCDTVRAVADYERAVALWRELGDRLTLSSSLAGLQGSGLSFQSETMASPRANAEQLATSDEAVRLARESGWRAGESFALWIRAGSLGTLGQYPVALDLTRQGIAIADEIEHVQWRAGSRWTLGVLLLDILCFTQARVHLERARDFGLASGSAHWKMNTAGSLAVALVGEGDLARAAAVLDEALPENAPYQSQGQRCVWRGRVELALARGRPEIALAMADRLFATTPHAERGIPRVTLIRAQALHMLGRTEEAEAEAWRAHAQSTKGELLGLVWRSSVLLGDILRKQRRAAEAEPAYQEARAIIARIAAALPDADLRTTFERETAALLPTETPSSRRVEAGRYGGLTAREREVALLVARGKSNRNIAGDLVLSERTVETHVTNILLKLNFTSRAQVAAWVVEMGLTRE
ncbi:MAG TPA: AAA family ATPase [Ktedonobacterales bacterium]|nr:AAA family ATPase [Ktedonobacterales bacterium]